MSRIRDPEFVASPSQLSPYVNTDNQIILLKQNQSLNQLNIHSIQYNIFLLIKLLSCRHSNTGLIEPTKFFS